jgi:hypothetical protein
VLFPDAATELVAELDPRPKPYESLRIAWLIAWRSTLIATLSIWLVVPVIGLGLTGILATAGASSNSIQVLLQLLSFAIQPTLILPVVLTMLLGKQFRGFEVLVERVDGGVSDLSFREALAPAWLLYWRTALLTLLPLLLIFLVSGIVSKPMSPFTSQLLGAAIALVAYWFVVQAMFAKKFKHFHFVVRRPGAIRGR